MMLEDGETFRLQEQEAGRMDLEKSSPSTPARTSSLQPARPFSQSQQMAQQESDVDRLWRECIALNRFGARTEDYTFAGRRH